MKILFIHNKYGKFSGEEAVVESQIKLLKENGHEVITYFRSSEELETMFNAKLKAFFSAFYNSRSIKELKELIAKEKPDVVHIHNLYPLISPAILPAIKNWGIPIVMTVHNYRLLCPNGLFFNNGEICEKCIGVGKEIHCITNNCEGSLFKSTGYAARNFWARSKKYYLEHVDRYFCLTAFQKNKLAANGFIEKKLEILPNFYNKEIKPINYNIKNRNYIAFAGRISPEKGIPLLLEAARNLPEIPFKLAGGIREGYLEKLDIPANVEMMGMLDPEQLSTFYDNAIFFILTSIWYEGFPMVLPEAMAHKLPIIAPNMAGYPEVVEENKNGLLFKTGDVTSLSNTIKKLWNDAALCKTLGENGYQKVQAKYSNTPYYKKLEKSYRELLNK